MKRIGICGLLLLWAFGAAAQTVYVPWNARRTPSCTTAQGRELRPCRMRGDTLERQGVRFVRLPRLQLVLCIGQSNMAGRGPLDDAARDTLDGVWLFDAEGRFAPAVEPLNRYSTVRKELGMQQVGPAGSFASAFVGATGRPVGLVVNARGGTSIDEWIGPKGQLLDAALARLRAAQAWGDVAGVLWHQGEADAAHPQRYEARLRLLVERLRAELEAPQLPFVFGQIARWNWTRRPEGTAPFNAMLRELHLPHTACVGSEGLEPMKDESDPHFSAASQRELGRRYAEALLRLQEINNQTDK